MPYVTHTYDAFEPLAEEAPFVSSVPLLPLRSIHYKLAPILRQTFLQ